MGKEQTVPVRFQLDLRELVETFGWLQVQLFERFPQGLGDRIHRLDGFFASVRDEIGHMELCATSCAGGLIIRPCVLGRAELLAAALAALECDVSQISGSHEALR